MIFYKVSHKYKLNGHYERKNIGIYSSKENAEKAIETLKVKKGFKDTAFAFKITKVFCISEPKLIDKIFWIDGFVTYTCSRSYRIDKKRFLHFVSNGFLIANLIAFAFLLPDVRWWTVALAVVFLAYTVILLFDKRKIEWSWWSLFFMSVVSVAIPICYIFLFELYFYFAIIAVEIVASCVMSFLLKRN